LKIDNSIQKESNYYSSIPEIPKDLDSPEKLLLFVKLTVFQKVQYKVICNNLLYEVRQFASDILCGYVSPSDIYVRADSITGKMDIIISKHILKYAFDVLAGVNRYLT